ncbi:hypothetical protein HDA32_001280 [Spinactinospora alkalitolerans]|uniref:Uncharacterized protein n=1 Tax=Spinactinospora alkalitolerans TaxID=687207 RepID=A0A852TWC2_9ACTN|nr:hypothetical protein [Spinactinospora alkalitolerans]NYE46160.1 hypothetical protein [Spinactinospora alkalitolerans]
MRKPHKTWVALAAAAAVSVTGFGALGATAAAADRPALSWDVPGQESSYSLDGFSIGYLPPGLEGQSMKTHAAAEDGARTSYVAWTEGRGATNGKVTIIRSDEIRTLEDLRDSRYRRLDAESLEKIDNNGREAYLSRSTGDLFWVERPGVGVLVYLRPERWDSGELVRMGEGVQERRGFVRPTFDGFDGVSAQFVSVGRSRDGEPSADSGYWNEAGEDSQDSKDAADTAAVKQCLADYVLTPPPSALSEDMAKVQWDEERWNEAAAPERKAAVDHCAEQLGIEKWRINALLAETEKPAEEESADDETETPRSDEAEEPRSKTEEWPWPWTMLPWL